MTHEIKLNKEFIRPVYSGEKNFEIRFNDRGYQKSDLIKFRIWLNEVDPDDLDMARELMKRTYRITYVINGWGIKNGYVVFGIERLIGAEGVDL